MKTNHFNAGYKRVFLIFTLLVFVMLIFAGCSSDTNTTDDPSLNNGESSIPGDDPAPDEPDEEDPVVDEPADDPDEGVIDSEELKNLFRKGREMDEISYTMIHTGIADEQIETRIWHKGDNMKTETTVMGNKVIMLINEEEIYTLSETEKIAMKMPMGHMDDDDETFTMDDFTDNILDEELTYLGKENVNGISCHVVESRGQNDEDGVKMWLHEDYGIPMKMQSLDQDGDSSFTMEVTSFETGNISDEEFVVPEDYQILDFGNFNMPGLPSNP